MKFLLLIALGCYIVACIHLTTTTPYANADPEANADPDPLVGQKLKETCLESMGDAKFYNVLCKNAADLVVKNVAEACHKVSEYGCVLASWFVDYDKCYDKIKNLICPANKPASVAIEGKSQMSSTTIEAPKSKDDENDEHPSWVGQIVIDQCKKYVKPIADNITDNGQQPFETKAFCKQLGHAGRDACNSTLIGQCDHFPES